MDAIEQDVTISDDTFAVAGSNVFRIPEHDNAVPSVYSKKCGLCHSPNDVLVRCQIDDTRRWQFVCTKQCWKRVSGGTTDGDSAHPFYKYGGMWKNKHEAVSAKKPKRKAKDVVGCWQGEGVQHVRNDRVRHSDKTWQCRKSHRSDEQKAPTHACTFWKEVE